MFGDANFRRKRAGVSSDNRENSLFLFGKVPGEFLSVFYRFSGFIPERGGLHGYSFIVIEIGQWSEPRTESRISAETRDGSREFGMKK